jgi:hypothetical protein
LEKPTTSFLVLDDELVEVLLAEPDPLAAAVELLLDDEFELPHAASATMTAQQVKVAASPREIGFMGTSPSSGFTLG